MILHPHTAPECADSVPFFHLTLSKAEEPSLYPGIRSLFLQGDPALRLRTCRPLRDGWRERTISVFWWEKLLTLLVGHPLLGPNVNKTPPPTLPLPSNILRLPTILSPGILSNNSLPTLRHVQGVLQLAMLENGAGTGSAWFWLAPVLFSSMTRTPPKS